MYYSEKYDLDTYYRRDMDGDMIEVVREEDLETLSDEDFDRYLKELSRSYKMSAEAVKARVKKDEEEVEASLFHRGISEPRGEIIEVIR